MLFTVPQVVRFARVLPRLGLKLQQRLKIFITYVLSAVLMFHWLACLWYLVPQWEQAEASWFEKYIAAQEASYPVAFKKARNAQETRKKRATNAQGQLLVCSACGDSGKSGPGCWQLQAYPAPWQAPLNASSWIPRHTAS